MSHCKGEDKGGDQQSAKEVFHSLITGNNAVLIHGG